ncbi:MAG: thiamine pyrophosphate-dependent enzyme [Candidatus Dojkabacteria bacterium]|nr:thiamine pyrophosphate-dependent enzyme [Candidatus Dojkabacteria bacterium]
MKTSNKQQRNRKETAPRTASLPVPSFPRCYKESSKPHKFCPGCGHPITLHEIGMVVDELGIQNKTAFLIDIGCSLLAWDFFDIDTTQTHHGRTVPTAVGFKRAMPDATVIAYLGDGGGYAIGTQHLVHATLRNDPITVIIINNLTYAMTGGQMAPTTIEKQPPTTTAPFDRTPDVFGTNLKGPELVLHLAMPGAFVARTAVDNPLHVRMTIKEALLHQQKNKAFSFVEVLSFCPTNWKTNAQETFAWMGAFKETYPLFKTITGTNS